MATVVLSAVGAIVGGPIGAAVGAVIGQQVDNAIFAPGRRQGPRLGDLTVQTSSLRIGNPEIVRGRARHGDRHLGNRPEGSEERPIKW